MKCSNDPPKPVHVRGIAKGEEQVAKHGREPGRDEGKATRYRSARDATGIDAKRHGPIDPRMPNIPPA